MYYLPPRNTNTPNNYAPPKKRDKWLRKILVILLICNTITALYLAFTKAPDNVITSSLIYFWAGFLAYGIAGGIISVILDLIYAIFKYPKDWV